MQKGDDMPRKTDPAIKIMDATLELAAGNPWRKVTLDRIAAKAGMPLDRLHGVFGSRLAIVRAIIGHLDELALRAAAPEMDDENPRERLFEVIMARFEAMTPYKPALRSMAAGLAGDPLSALCLGPAALNSQNWMLAAAGIGTGGLRGRLRSRGLLVLQTRVFRVWLEDDSDDLSATMKALDSGLRRAERWMNRLDGPLGLASRLVHACCHDEARGQRKTGGSADLDTPPVVEA